MSNFDDLKLAVEALSGGKNTVLFDDDLGTGGESFPSIMVRVPMFHSLNVLAGAPDAPHPMFVVDDVALPEVFISKYQNIVMHDRAYNVGFRAAFLSDQMLGAQGPRVRAGRQKGLVSAPVGAAKNQALMETASNPGKLRARAATHEKTLGTCRRFLCAAAIGIMPPGRACSRSI